MPRKLKRETQPAGFRTVREFRAVSSFAEPEEIFFYRTALRLLTQKEVPFLVGGAYALQALTGIERYSKDLDLFIRKQDCKQAMRVFEQAGFRTELRFPHWLAKVYEQQWFIDMVFSSGNGSAPVDDGWFDHSQPAVVFDVAVNLVPVEEMIWQKAYIMERERYDGADVLHLIRAHAERIDWNRLLLRFGEHGALLLNYLVLFSFVYPSERHRLPLRVLRDLMRRFDKEMRGAPAKQRVCRGGLISRAQYRTDMQRWKYRDARLRPTGKMSARDIAEWTAAIEEPEQS